MKISADRETCIGAGNCADVAERYFDQSDDDGTVIVRRAAVDPGDESTVIHAADLCPVRAIDLTS